MLIHKIVVLFRFFISWFITTRVVYSVTWEQLIQVVQISWMGKDHIFMKLHKTFDSTLRRNWKTDKESWSFVKWWRKLLWESVHWTMLFFIATVGKYSASEETKNIWYCGSYKELHVRWKCIEKQEWKFQATTCTWQSCSTLSKSRHWRPLSCIFHRNSTFFMQDHLKRYLFKMMHHGMLQYKWANIHSNRVKKQILLGKKKSQLKGHCCGSDVSGGSFRETYSRAHSSPFTWWFTISCETQHRALCTLLSGLKKENESCQQSICSKTITVNSMESEKETNLLPNVTLQCHELQGCTISIITITLPARFSSSLTNQNMTKLQLCTMSHAHLLSDYKNLNVESCPPNEIEWEASAWLDLIFCSESRHHPSHYCWCLQLVQYIKGMT